MKVITTLSTPSKISTTCCDRSFALCLTVVTTKNAWHTTAFSVLFGDLMTATILFGDTGTTGVFFGDLTTTTKTLGDLMTSRLPFDIVTTFSAQLPMPHTKTRIPSNTQATFADHRVIATTSVNLFYSATPYFPTCVVFAFRLPTCVVLTSRLPTCVVLALRLQSRISTAVSRKVSATGSATLFVAMLVLVGRRSVFKIRPCWAYSKQRE